MVAQIREPRRVVSFQAGPGEVDAGPLFDVNLRVNDRAARAIGRQLAVIGDQLDQEWASREPNWPPAPLHMLRSTQALTRIIYRDLHSQLRGFKGLSAAVKDWMASTVPGQRMFRADAWADWVSNCKACTGWARRALVTVVLVAAVTIFGALWMEQKA